MSVNLNNIAVDPDDPMKKKIIPIQPLVDPDNLEENDADLTFSERAYIQELKNDDHKKQQQREVLKMLENLQGNILKGHDRNHGVLFFLRFKPNKQQEIKRQITMFANYVTSSRLQMQEWRLYHKHRISGGAFGNFFLTARGYHTLLKPEEPFEKFQEWLKEKKFDPSFVGGMQEANLNDLDPERYWEKPYRKAEDIHAMILVADDDESNLGEKVRMILRDVLKVGQLADIVAVEKGAQQRGDNEEPIEHFGFRDGISNPMFLATDEDKINKYGGITRWNPWAPLSVALSPDPLVEEEENCFGSYLVYRKYEQHVREFEVVMRNLADSLGLDSKAEDDLERVKALIIGRFRNGTPVCLKSAPYKATYLNNNYNNFAYDMDNGSKCPLHAHIRKANPRVEDLPNDRIVRRGITYGKRDFKQEKERGLSYLPNGGVGLLFMSFQGKVENFEKIHREMINNADFPEKRTGLDPLIGQAPQAELLPPQSWPLAWGKETFSYSNPISSCVTFKGGEYFFAPSIAFLRSLAGANGPAGDKSGNGGSEKPWA